jgi:carboxyl-terminal processing protease
MRSGMGLPSVMLKAIAVVVATVGCVSSAATATSRAGSARDKSASEVETLAPGIALATFDSVWAVVARTYVDTQFVATRWTVVRDSLRPRALSVTTRAGLTDLMAATLGQIHDSHFYIIPASVAAEVRPEDDNAGSGEGTTGVSVRIAGDRALVWRVEPGSPGALAGIAPGQTVEQIKERIARTSIQRVLSLPDASRQRALAELDFKLNGALSPSVGESVLIRIVRPGETKVIERALVAVPVAGTISKFGNLPPIAGRVRVARTPVTLGGGRGASCVGTIAFNIWLPALAPELQHAVDSVADCAGIVLDVRGNPGGVGGMVMGFGGYFLDSAISLGTMKTRDISLNFVINPRRIRVAGIESGPFKGPVAILVDPMTASTSEIFAAGLQRIGRARVFGEQSAGAALPALMQGLPSGDVFVHAVADFRDPAGRRIEGAGVLPDQIVLLTEKDLSANTDAPLEAAIRWIQSRAP